MKTGTNILMAAFVLLSMIAHAQKEHAVLLRNSIVPAQANIRKSFIDSFNRRAPRFHEKTYVVLQFTSLPSEDVKHKLAKSNVTLLDYIPDNAYTATVS